MNKWIAILGMVLLATTGCVKETVVVRSPLIVDADLYFEYVADNWGTTIEGELINDGETFIDAVQLEVRFYDRNGYIIDYQYVWVDTYFNPGEVVGFYFDFAQRGVYDVEVLINQYD